ncbi:MAG: hypothetical protein J6Q53_00175 [Oscillospiraceae bacterium]|nr:hypothetical protein [Oscillospiraceae bacterium]
MTGIYKVQRKHGVKWYTKVNYTVAGIHYQKKSSVFYTQKEARAAEIELQEWVRQVIQEAESGHTEPPANFAGTHGYRRHRGAETPSAARSADLWTGMGRVPKHAQNQRIEAQQPQGKGRCASVYLAPFSGCQNQGY